ncbi:MAG: outer membrane protein transport protein [Rhodanobacter sp.]
MFKPFRSSASTAGPLMLALLSASIAGALALPSAANASAFQLKEGSAKSMGRAYAGSNAAGGDASVVATNPAALSELDGTYLQADITAINFSAKFNGSAYDALGRPISGGNGGDGGTTLPVPSLFFATKVSDRVNVGLGLNVPFGFQTEYDHDWIGRYNGLKSRFQSMDATLSASFKVNDSFSIGGSVIAEKTIAELTNAVNFNGVGLGLVQQGVAAGAIPPAQAPALIGAVNTLLPPGSDGHARIYGDNTAWGWQAGALWKLSANDTLALDYRSRITHGLKGTANFTDIPPAVGMLLSNPAVAALLAGGTPFQHTTAAANFTTPATAGLSYWHQDQAFGLGVDLGWTQWDVMKQLTVNYANPAQPPSSLDFNWHDSWFASVGADWYVTDKLTLRGGVGLDTTPTRATTREPRVPDSTRQLASIGIGYKASEHFELNASFMHVFVNAAHLDRAASATGDVLTGAFDDYGNVLSLAAQYKF